MRAGKIARVAALPLFWALTALLMARDWANDPYDPKLWGTDRYGHNHEGALVQGLSFTLVELAVLVAILRPWSYDRSWARALVAVVLLTPWMMLSMLMSMHQGGIVFLHFSWIFFLFVGLVVTFFVSAISAFRSRTRSRFTSA
jgi:hypothetical protein